MADQKVITGNTEQEVWDALTPGLLEEDMLSFDVLIKQGDQSIQLYIDIDPGGGFEGGSEITMISAPLPFITDFRFAIHHESFIDEIGKFFGMQDVITGYTEFDNLVVVKTNNEDKVRRLFEDEAVRQIFSDLNDYGFGIHTHHPNESNADHPYLEFTIDQAFTDIAVLRQVYHAFCTVLNKIRE